MIGIQLCDRYQIQKKLSDKAGRQTYLAQGHQHNEPVIIQVLNFGDATTWEHFKLFEREAKILQHLSHPAIPKYQDYLDIDSGDSKGFALVQTYIQAQSLAFFSSRDAPSVKWTFNSLPNHCWKFCPICTAKIPPLSTEFRKRATLSE